MISHRELDWDAARDYHQRAVAADPWNPLAHQDFATFLLEQGEVEAALRRGRRAVEMDPQWSRSHASLGWMQFHLGDYEAALENFERAFALAPGPGGQSSIATAKFRIDLARGDERAAIEHFARAVPPDTRAAVLEAGQAGGIHAARRVRVDQVVADEPPCGRQADLSAPVYAVLGMPDEMFRCLNVYVDQWVEPRMMMGRLYLKTSTFWDDYRDDPRFDAILRRMNLAPEPSPDLSAP